MKVKRKVESECERSENESNKHLTFNIKVNITCTKV
jgi:hypothetical protein